MSQQIDKILHFRQSNFGVLFVPMSSFRGAYNAGGGYLAMYFDDVRGVDSDDTTTDYTSTEVRIRFNSGDFFKEAVEEMVAKIYSANSPVVTIVDATVPNNDDFIRSAVFGTYNQYLHGHSTNASVAAADVDEATTLSFTLQSET